MADLASYVAETGEGKWAVQEGMDNKLSLSVLTALLYARWQSQKDSYSAKIVAALREQFGGHEIKK